MHRAEPGFSCIQPPRWSKIETIPMKDFWVNKGEKIMFQGKICVIVGEVRNLGASVAKQFAARRCNIAFMDSDKESGRKLANVLSQEFDVDAFFFHGNTRSEEDLEIFASAVVDQYGSIDFFINNASMEQGSRNPGYNALEKTWEALRVSVVSPYILDKMFREHFETGGVEVYTVPEKDCFPKEDEHAYRMVKESVEALTRICTETYNGHVSVNCICVDENNETDRMDIDIASAICLLCEDKSRFSNGKSMYADGALWRMMAYPVRGEWKFVF